MSLTEPTIFSWNKNTVLKTAYKEKATFKIGI